MYPRYRNIEAGIDYIYLEDRPSRAIVACRCLLLLIRPLIGLLLKHLVNLTQRNPFPIRTQSVNRSRKTIDKISNLLLLPSREIRLSISLRFREFLRDQGL